MSDGIPAEATATSPMPTTPQSRPSPPSGKTSRTVVIIKNHALQHRFEIEHRIQEASFEIVKERQMELDMETDPQYLYELFGDDANSFNEGPLWVYVLERRNSIHVMNTLLGDPNPEIARQVTPTSLRALYGLSHAQNGIMSSPDVTMAEAQIEALFASSPPFPISDLPDLNSNGPDGSMRSVSSSVLSALRRVGSDGGSSNTNPSSSNPHHKGFKARAIPATHSAPDIAPRTTRAAALRAGIPVEALPKALGPRAPLTKEQTAKTFKNVPGHKREGSIAVASTAAPTIAPRMSRAASLRLGQPVVTPVRRQSSIGIPGAGSSTFEGVPGHKRRESIAVASVVNPPSVAPRLNKSAALRANKEVAAPPSSFMFRTGSAAKTPGLSRSNSQASFNLSTTTTASRPSSSASYNPAPTRAPPAPSVSRTSATVSRAASSVSRVASSVSRVASNFAQKATPSKTSNNKQPNGRTGTPPTPVSPAPKPQLKSRPSVPSIAPKTNRSAALRAAKQEADNAAAAAKALRGGKSGSARRALVA